MRRDNRHTVCRKAAWMVAEHEVFDKAYMIKLTDTGGLYAYNKKKISGLVPWYNRRFWNVTVP